MFPVGGTLGLTGSILMLGVLAAIFLFLREEVRTARDRGSEVVATAAAATTAPATEGPA
jgi:hypothetical protein